jgi:hypothetical protein
MSSSIAELSKALRRPAESFLVVAGALTLVNFSEFSAMPQP